MNTKQQKKRATPPADGWVKFEGDFTAEELGTAARAGAPIPQLSITKTRFTQPRSLGLRGMRAERLWLWCNVTKAALHDVLAIEGLRILDVLEIEESDAMPSFATAASLEEFRCPMGLSTRDIEAVLQAPALRELSVQSSTLDLPLARAMAAKPTLRKLDIEMTKFDDEMAEVIASNHLLTHLDIGCAHITARGLAHICRMRQLESIDLWATGISIDDLQMITALDRLEYLSLGAVDDGSTDGLRVDGNPSQDAQAVVDLILRMPSVRRVWLDGIQLSVDQRQALESRLESLRN
jgi:Leucine Rich repeat